MPRNGSGSFVPLVNSWNPQTAGVSATPADFGAQLTDIATALTQSVSADGQTAITGNIAMGGNKLTGLAAGSATGNSVRWEQLFSQGTEADIASASTCDIGGQNTNFLRVTGTTQIDSLGTNYNGPRFLRFAGALALKYNATTLITPGAADITTVAGDRAIVVPVASGGTANGWQVVAYQRAAGLNALAVDASSCGVTQSTGRMLGRITAGSGNIEQLTAAQVAAFTAAASDTAQGAVELATTAEVQTGTDTVRAVTPNGLRGGLTVIGTAASATGTSVPYSSIPSWVTEIDCHFSGVSSTLAGHILVQIGTGGSATTSGYSSASCAVAGTNTVVGTSASNGFVIYTGVAGETFTGRMTIKKMTGNQWTSTHAGNKSGYVSSGGGNVTLAGTLDYLRFLNSTGDFDAGTVNITYR